MKRYTDSSWKESMRLSFDFNNMMAEFIGEEGIQWEQIKALDSKLNEAAAKMVEKRKAGDMEWRELPYNQDEVVKDILKTAAEIKEKI